MNQSVGLPTPSLNFDDKDKFSSVRNYTLHVNYALTESISTQTASYPRHDTCRMMANIFHDPIQLYFMIPHPRWAFSQKNRRAKKTLAQSFSSSCLGKTS